MFAEQTWVAKGIWALLVLFLLDALFVGNWPLAFVSLATLVLSLAPVYMARWARIVVPPSFVAAIVLFVGGTLFLGEVFGFYERFWWWDLVMHAGSAVGFGLIGFILIFMMFQGDRFAAPAVAIAFFAFCFALAIGALWEIFEFGMDQAFGLNMQKSGLMDTMGDLIVDTLGALVGAGSGWAYLKWQSKGGLARIIDDFVARNPRFFSRFKK
ncbi:hypothetical protein M8756_08150 [Lutimaribacter sp. EGI FJ00015]|uniref:Uncharacterized protein n=1 Tax=Lutimaribacter degradans TaxID=2945989 RepID=A0ACC5ZVJ6_9RHOB|nr:hypothetical protein [Lutimaribacter sp. EGI FJ00013]MCM2562125.1 hypothetical protein [Lutimaribacter sp. EGI FJ00013]MCO0613278.1 hypothetical protein [Lutimaribacter sp. EGI FJ00015]MCO0636255.1 hypothetical protein [Lutimaribacter sp. EGI FJ00014]